MKDENNLWPYSLVESTGKFMFSKNDVRKFQYLQNQRGSYIHKQKTDDCESVTWIFNEGVCYFLYHPFE